MGCAVKASRRLPARLEVAERVSCLQDGNERDLQVMLWMPPLEASKALEASECSELLDHTRERERERELVDRRPTVASNVRPPSTAN